MAERPRKQLRIVMTKPAPRQSSEDTLWVIIQSEIRKIYSKQLTEAETAHGYVNYLFSRNMGARLHDRIVNEIDSLISSALRLLVEQTEDINGFLTLVLNCWNNFRNQMPTICAVATGMGSKYLERTPTGRTYWGLALRHFRDQFLASSVKQKTVSGLVEMISRERLGKAIDRNLLDLVKMFIQLEIYQELEKPLLQRASEVYKAEGDKFLQQLDVPDYLEHIEKLLQQVDKKSVDYLDVSTHKHIVETAEAELLVRHIPAMLEKDVTSINGMPNKDHQRVWLLFDRVNALEPLRQSLIQYIQHVGRTIFVDGGKEYDMLSNLSEFNANLLRMWELKSRALTDTISTEFEHFFSHFKTPVTELICKFVDKKLRAGNKGTSEEALDNVLALLRYLSNRSREEFIDFHRNALASRLLRGKSASIDAEKLILTKLKDYPVPLAYKFEVMFKDIEFSKEINEKFKKSSQAQTKHPSGIEFSVNVLTDGYWPTFTPRQLPRRLPLELDVYKDNFETFFRSEYRSRKLMWENSLGHCVLKAVFPEGEMELEVSMFQTIVLMLFNDKEKLKFQDIKNSTHIEDEELRFTLRSLSREKFRVLKKDDDDTFSVNDQLKVKNFRVKLTSFQPQDRAKDISRRLNEKIDVAIIQIMKKEKTLSHRGLISNLIQLKFPEEMLKKRIDGLISRDYMERDPKNHEMYNYIP